MTSSSASPLRACCLYHRPHWAMLYARFGKRRLEKCLYGEEKPTRSQCPVHCYKPEPRAQIREIMAWSGPKQLLKHPVVTIQHILDGLRPVPDHPRQKRRSKRPPPRLD